MEAENILMQGLTQIVRQLEDVLGHGAHPRRAVEDITDALNGLCEDYNKAMLDTGYLVNVRYGNPRYGGKLFRVSEKGVSTEYSSVRDLTLLLLDPSSYITEQGRSLPSERRLEEADNECEKWMDEHFKTAPFTDRIEAEATINEARAATEQDAFERGIRAGARLILDLLGH